jgi:hypothetical protein
MNQPPITAAYVTDLEMAQLWCGQDTRLGLFIAPCGAATLIPGIRALHKTAKYTLPDEAAQACGKLAQAFTQTQAPPAISPRPARPPVAPELQEARKILHQVLQTTTPCNIPGCDAWRTQLTAKLASLPEDCPACDRSNAFSQVIHSNVDALAAWLKQNPDYKLPTAASAPSSAP